MLIFLYVPMKVGTFHYQPDQYVPLKAEHSHCCLGDNLRLRSNCHTSVVQNR